jgi:hypothetical protein
MVPSGIRLFCGTLRNAASPAGQASGAPSELSPERALDKVLAVRSSVIAAKNSGTH